MKEFDAHDIDTSVKLDGNERNQRQQKAKLGAPTTQPKPPPQIDNIDREENSVDENDNDPDQGHEEEPSLFNILEDNEYEDDNNNNDNPDPTGQE